MEQNEFIFQLRFLWTTFLALHLALMVPAAREASPLAFGLSAGALALSVVMALAFEKVIRDPDPSRVQLWWNFGRTQLRAVVICDVVSIVT